jgi:hypothetical protein
VEITAAHPGTQVSIAHSRIALVENESEPVRAPAAEAHPASSAIKS